MSHQSRKTRTWAILIGVDFYGNAAKPLLGAVSDANQIEEYLLGNGVEAQNISKLTSSPPTQLESTTPREEQRSWPTYQNVIASLQKIEESATSGDLIYFHFSGHGTQPKRSHLRVVHLCRLRSQDRHSVSTKEHRYSNHTIRP